MGDGGDPQIGIAGGGALWHGRFASGPAAELMAFTESIGYDRRLLIDDVAGSKAHARGLHRGGLLTEDELGLVLGALDTVEIEYRAGDLDIPAERRGRPHGDRTTGDRDRRCRRSEAAHGAIPQRPGGHGIPPLRET